MSNKKRCLSAIHAYIDSLDDEGLYELISEQMINGPDIFGCINCEAEHGTDECDEPGICEKRFEEWINK